MTTTPLSSEMSAAFEKAVEPYHAYLFRRAMKLVGNYALAEDMVQETLIKAAANFHKYKSGNFQGWLSRILANTVTSFLRHRVVMKQVPYTSEIHNVIENVPAEETDDMELSDEMARALSKLPENYKEILVRSAEQISYKDIAEELQIPIGTVMSRLFRARNMVKRSLNVN